MCGIAGFCLSKEDRVNAKRLARHMLLGIEPRGRDATGLAFRAPTTGDVSIHKNPIPAHKFVMGDVPINRHARTAILHTRFATQGSVHENVNNHPIRTGGITGVHNGVIDNDYKLFADMDLVGLRIGQVDSEAIFAALAYGFTTNENGERRIKGAESIADILKVIEGSAAIAWLDDEDSPDVLHLARLSSSPLFVAQSANASLFFGSSRDAVTVGMRSVGLESVWDMYMTEGQYIRVEGGVITEKQEFTPCRRKWIPFRGGYTSSVWQKEDDEFDLIRWVEEKKKNRDANKAAAAADDAPIRLPEDPFLATELMCSDILKELTGPSHLLEYGQREREMEEYRDALDLKNPNRWELLSELKAYLRQGDWVYTKVGTCRVYGQVYELPQCFPGGKYLLRLVMPNESRTTNSEWVLVARFVNEFWRCSKGEGLSGLSDARKGKWHPWKDNDTQGTAVTAPIELPPAEETAA